MDTKDLNNSRIIPLFKLFIYGHISLMSVKAPPPSVKYRWPLFDIYQERIFYVEIQNVKKRKLKLLVGFGYIVCERNQQQRVLGSAELLQVGGMKMQNILPEILLSSVLVGGESQGKTTQHNQYSASRWWQFVYKYKTKTLKIVTAFVEKQMTQQETAVDNV